ncbi:MAG TPA: HAD family phosphatase [Acidimicrobiales bacterium]|jgi:epoxide hydrolase-like predicted phosphatase|nr:HAD family phosphatase [Acidimicrobiales bacterium]
MIEAVLWDFGGVFTPSPFVACRAYAVSLGVEPAVLMDIIFGPYHEDTDHPWHQAERGEGLVQDALDHSVAEAARHGFVFEPQALFAAMRDDGVDRTIVVDKVRELRGCGLRMSIVTNNAKEFSDAWHRLVPIELFDDVVDSSQVGMRKPNPAIYELALQRLSVAASHAAFLDDFLPNVVAARAVGLVGVHVEHPVAALAELDRAIAAAR